VAGGHDGAGGGDLMDEALQEDMFFPSKVNAVTASTLPDCEECFGCNTQLQLMQVSVHPYQFFSRECLVAISVSAWDGIVALDNDRIGLPKLPKFFLACVRKVSHMG
jgi:hypothetical protein